MYNENIYVCIETANGPDSSEFEKRGFDRRRYKPPGGTEKAKQWGVNIAELRRVANVSHFLCLMGGLTRSRLSPSPGDDWYTFSEKGWKKWAPKKYARICRGA